MTSSNVKAVSKNLHSYRLPLPKVLRKFIKTDRQTKARTYIVCRGETYSHRTTVRKHEYIITISV